MSTKVKVSQYTTAGKYIMTFDSTSEAAKAVGSTRQAIYNACHKPIVVGGFRWAYIHEPVDLKTNGRPGKPAKRVRCIELRKVYPSVSAAARAMDCSQALISMACGTGVETACGMHWEFV